MGFQHDPAVPPAALSSEVTLPPSVADVEQVQSVRTPIAMDYEVTPGAGLSTYLRALKQKRILGDVCPDTGQVIIPPRGVAPMAGKRPVEMVEVADTGYIDSFNVTRIPIKSRPDLEPPYVSAWVVPDGANAGSIALVGGVDPDEVRIGMRVRAVWKPDDELEESAANILYWEPTGEPDEEIEDMNRFGRVDIAQGVPAPGLADREMLA